MYKTDDFRVTLSFAQMAAIMNQDSLSAPEIKYNRIIGSLRLVGGIVELAGAGVLCALPEPTLISKAGCVAMGVHASDQLSAASTQILTGQQTDSLAFKGGASVAKSFGASKDAGQVIGLAMEFAVPLSTASLYNAFRVSSVRAGRMTVVTSEIPLHAPKKLGGGHTIAKHVGKALEFLQQRLASRKVHIASTFHDLATAELAVSQAIHENKLKILMYSKVKFLLKRPQVEFITDLNRVIGWGITKNAPNEVIEMSKVHVIIKLTDYNHMPYFIITAFPVK
jgi:hypothetical protein